MSIGEGGEDEPTGGEWVGAGAHDVAGGGQGCGNAVVVVDEGVRRVDGDMADVAEASTGCGTDCGWLRESQP